MKATLEEILRELASEAPSPGGGTAAALAGCLGASLLSMACKISGRKVKRTSECKAARIASLVARAEEASRRLLRLAEDDASAYSNVTQAKRRAREQGAAPEGFHELNAAYRRASEVPLAVARLSLELLNTTLEVATSASDAVSSDVWTAFNLLVACCKSAAANVLVNISQVEEHWRKTLEQELEGIQRELKACLGRASGAELFAGYRGYDS